ncbi:MAG: tripartite tricarboxylate transporter TctB family protein [Gemmatimonadota bacterium]|nr:tripartite tricarboxylate transporter TctB family protein [Gemmatimonadota bacterium]
MSGRVDRVVGAMLALSGILGALEASTYDVGFMTDPVGPKALPYLVCVTLVGVGVTALLRPRAYVVLPDAAALVRMTGAVVAFLAYAGALPVIGFFVSTTLVTTALSLLFRGPLRGSLVAGTVLSGGLWLLFVELLSLPLPIGDLWIR